MKYRLNTNIAFTDLGIDYIGNKGDILDFPKSKHIKALETKGLIIKTQKNKKDE